MVVLTSKEAKEKFGILMDTARREPVTITKRGRPSVMVLSIERFEELEALEDAIWAARADEAAKGGFLSAEDTAKFIQRMLNADVDLI